MIEPSFSLSEVNLHFREMDFKDHFSRQAQIYAQSRPTYPDELFQFLYSIASEHEICWDCATGNGQAAVSLARYFKKVIAIDGSESQIRNAQPASNVEYRVATADQSGLEDHSVDLITVATAAHWFNQALFYLEARRVSKPGAILALWTYSVAAIQPDIDEVMQWFMNDKLGNFWPSGREYVMEEYKTLPFPFIEIETPKFYCRKDWKKEQWLNYLRSWSAYDAYVLNRKSDPLDDLTPKLERLWNDTDTKEVVWKLHMKVSRL